MVEIYKKWNRYRKKISGNMNCFDLLGFTELSRIAQKGARQGNSHIALLIASGMVDLEREGNRKASPLAPLQRRGEWKKMQTHQGEGGWTKMPGH